MMKKKFIKESVRLVEFGEQHLFDLFAGNMFHLADFIKNGS